MTDEIRVLDALIAHGTVPPDDRDRHVDALLRAPDRADWATFVHHFGLALGTASTLAGIVYLVAFNWAALGFFPKLLVASSVTLGCAALAAARGPRTLVGSLAAVGGAVTSGAGLVVYSQHWQTGADPWTLFATWAALALPFAVAARTSAAWAVPIALADAAVLAWAGDQGIEAVAGAATALAVGHVAISAAAAGTWLAPALRITAGLALVGAASGFAIGRETWGAPAYGLVVVGFLAVQAAYLLRRVEAGAAGIAWVTASALAMVELVSQLVDLQFRLVGLTTVPGLAVLALTVSGFAWLVGVPRLRVRDGGDA